MPAPAPPADARARRLAEALRVNLRRRKAATAAAPDQPRDGGGAPDGEGLYPPRPGEPGET